MMTHKILNRDPKAPTPPDSPKASGRIRPDALRFDGGHCY